jgi:iron(III) transport system ATP-binding protein
VTHDQAEAMTTADLIAVMNHGRVEQLGTPEEVYYRPSSEFVARFIGGSNILRGIAADKARVTVAGASLLTSGLTLAPGQTVAVSIRQHAIRLLSAAPDASLGNVLPATVSRQIFLGATRDFFLTLQGGSEMRVTAPPEPAIAPGTAVWLHLPAEHCRALAR